MDFLFCLNSIKCYILQELIYIAYIKSVCCDSIKSASLHKCVEHKIKDKRKHKCDMCNNQIRPINNKKK